MDREFATRQIQPQQIVGIRTENTMDKLPELLGSLFQEVFGYIQKNGQEPAGMPLTIYHNVDGDQLDFECGMPVAAPIAGTERVRAGELPGGTVATVTHMGPYDDLGETWMALKDWIAAEGLQEAGSPWEVYVTDPGSEPDPSKWRTDIFFPVR